jgi:putative SOS response-associated peptidase YedK
MCGRYTFTSPEEAARALFKYTSPPLNLRPNYNVAPTHDVPIVRNRADGGGREMVQVRWGLIPFWAKDTKIAFSTINARVETVQTSGTYRNAFKSRRCLVVADGFYEWKKLDPKGKEKQPYRITLKSGQPFGFAGLWETWGKGTDAIVSCTIITGPPNELVAKIHDRMAVILPPEHWDAWLGGTAGTEVLKPYPAKLMRAYPVDKRVGNVKNNDAKLLEPISA